MELFVIFFNNQCHYNGQCGTHVCGDGAVDLCVTLMPFLQIAEAGGSTASV